MDNYKVGDIVEMKKSHPCSIKSKTWKILELSGDVKMECTNCKHIVVLKRYDFDKNLIKVVKGEI